MPFNQTLRKFVKDTQNNDKYRSNVESYVEMNDFYKLEMRNAISLAQCTKDGAPLYIEITFNKKLAKLIDFDLLVSCIGNNADDIQIEGFRKCDRENGDVVLQYRGNAYGGSYLYLQYAIKFYLEYQHKSIMKKDAKAFPLFHARMEMDEILDEMPMVSSSYSKTCFNFFQYKQTMVDLVTVLKVLKGEMRTTGNSGYSLATGKEESRNKLFKGQMEYKKVVYSYKQDLEEDKVFEKLLKQLHSQSKEMLVSKKGAVIGGLMVAFGALMVAAGVALGIMLSWTGVGLFAGAGLIAGGAALATGGVVTIKEREHSSKVGRLMNNHYNMFKRLYNDEVDKPAQPDANNTPRLGK